MTQGVQVELFLAPLPSEVVAKSKLYAVIEEYLLAFARRTGLLVRGSYFAERYGLTMANFYDGLHPRQDVYDAIYNEIIIN